MPKVITVALVSLAGKNCFDQPCLPDMGEFSLVRCPGKSSLAR